MSVNAGIVQLVTTVRSLGEMLPLAHVMLGIIVHLAHQAQGRSLATLGHTVMGTTRNQSCVPLEPSSLTTPEQVLMTVSTVLQVRFYILNSTRYLELSTEMKNISI